MDEEIDIAPVRSWDALEREWRALEAAAAPSFFQTWTWVGCLVEERFPDPVLIRAARGGRTVGLALFNRRHGRLSLTEHGDPARDAPFIEHNGPLLAAGAGGASAEMLAAAWRIPGIRRLQLSGVSPDLVAEAGGIARQLQDRPVPIVDLDAVRAAGGDYLATRSANTRQQIRRSNRTYEAHGPLTRRAAQSETEALSFLEGLAALHAETWNRRGKPGAFADMFVQRFHRALVLRALARDELDLHVTSAGKKTLGYLYNFRYRKIISSYQSGLIESPPGSPGKPGLSSHALAISEALRDGYAVYDFLAGDHRYKRSLSNHTENLQWAELLPRRSVMGLAISAVTKFSWMLSIRFGRWGQNTTRIT